jgi:hypothetical protein
MKDTPLVRLERLGQSIWTDFIRRGDLRLPPGTFRAKGLILAAPLARFYGLI